MCSVISLTSMAPQKRSSPLTLPMMAALPQMERGGPVVAEVVGVVFEQVVDLLVAEVVGPAQMLSR